MYKLLERIDRWREREGDTQRVREEDYREEQSGGAFRLKERRKVRWRSTIALPS